MDIVHKTAFRLYRTELEREVISRLYRTRGFSERGKEIKEKVQSDASA